MYKETRDYRHHIESKKELLEMSCEAIKEVVDTLNLEDLEVLVNSMDSLAFTACNSGDILQGKVRLSNTYISIDLKSDRRDLIFQLDREVSGLVNEYFRP
tara:strand:- start:409 stop:708 length:300 start_codon:yes stop_codon:yes gene_type:complete